MVHDFKSKILLQESKHNLVNRKFIKAITDKSAGAAELANRVSFFSLFFNEKLLTSILPVYLPPVQSIRPIDIAGDYERMAPVSGGPLGWCQSKAFF